MDVFELAHQVNERLYGGGKVKFKIIFHYLNILKKLYASHGNGEFNEFTRTLSEGNLDEYMMGMVECLEDGIDLEKLADKLSKNDYCIPDIPIKKITEICEDENALHLEDMGKLDKDSSKKLFKRINELP